jgi:uncharacterized protein DUF1592/uncharacterized protein DUF1588/uncharacterized protein DUF1595/uncharacterized protein DUF1585
VGSRLRDVSILPRWRGLAAGGGLAAGLLLALACSSEPKDDPLAPGMTGTDAPAEPDGSGDEPSAEPPPSDPDCAPGRIARRAVWLSDIQFANSITRLLGADALPAERAPDAALKPFSQKGVVVNTSLLRERLDLAERAASALGARFSATSGCTADDDACAREFVARFAERAFRRPVTDAERTELLGVYELGRAGGPSAGAQLAVQAIIGSPSFNYRTEFGDVAPDAPGNVELGGYELASLLSYWLTDGPPDDELAELAAQGRLADPAELTRQVDRLLAQPEAQDAVTLTLMSAWGMSNVFGATKDPALFPGYGPLLQSNMFEETRLFLNQALWAGDGSLAEVLTSRKSFVNAALAELYGVPFTGDDPTEFVSVELPAGERSGLLTQASLLAGRARSDNTSVVARGLFMRSALLCLQRPPPPPEEVIAQVQALLEADLSERERADFRAMTSPCNGCHATMDAYGLMLERYDAVGRYRTELDGEPIDASVEFGQASGFSGSFADVGEFAASVAESPRFTSCVARHLAVYATGDEALTARSCELDAFENMSASGANLRQIVVSLAGSPLLRTRSGETP